MRKAAAAGSSGAGASPSHGGSLPGAAAAVHLAHPAEGRRSLAWDTLVGLRTVPSRLEQGCQGGPGAGQCCWARAWLSPAPLRAGTAPSLQALGPLPGQRRVNTTCHSDPNSRPGGWGRGPGGLSPLCPCLSRPGEPRPGHSTAGMASPALSRGEGSPPSSCCQGFAQCSPGYHSPPPLGKGTLLAPGQPGVRQDPRGLFCHAACQQLCQAAFGHE